MKKDEIITAISVVAVIALALDVFAIALQIHTLPLWLLRIYYVPALILYVFCTAQEDIRHRKELAKMRAEYMKKKREQQFLEDYARFVSEVHK
ncbi:MAG TPA: hypothetical protein PLS20_11170 [Ruminococcus flavefaciens]|nr:hypothetical protein [Ruminococcus flavefaciens]